MARLIFSICVLLLLAAAPAHAARLALVIGIDAYKNVEPLRKAIGDARAMAARLTQLGFTVTTVFDADRRTLNKAITDFRKAIRPNDDVLFHFSGHGVEIAGHNLLLPADIPAPQEGESDFLAEEALSLQDLIVRLDDTKAATRIYVIDACRDNPFASRGTRGLGGSRGLSALSPPNGTFVFYSAGANQSALDELGPTDQTPTSVYTRVLLETLGRPGMSLSDLALEVRTRVASLAGSVGHTQNPAYYDQLSERFFFVPAGAEPLPEPKPTEEARAPTADAEATAFTAAQSIGTADAWTAFLRHHPQGFYADLARAALGKLASVEVKPAPVPRSEPRDHTDDLRRFVLVNFVNGSLTDRRRMERIYATSVDYYGSGRISREALIADKAKYARRWTSLHYEMIDGSFSARSLGDARYLITYLSRFDLTNAKGGSRGVAESRLIVDLSTGSPVVLSEKGDVVTKE